MCGNPNSTKRLLPMGKMQIGCIYSTNINFSWVAYETTHNHAPISTFWTSLLGATDDLIEVCGISNYNPPIRDLVHHILHLNHWFPNSWSYTPPVLLVKSCKIPTLTVKFHGFGLKHAKSPCCLGEIPYHSPLFLAKSTQPENPTATRGTSEAQSL